MKQPKKKEKKTAATGVPPAIADQTVQWINDLRWTNAFLPSLTQYFYTSPQPFSNFKRDSEDFLDIVQQAFDAAFPNIDYKLQSGDAFVAEVSFNCKPDLIVLTFKTGL